MNNNMKSYLKVNLVALILVFACGSAFGQSSSVTLATVNGVEIDAAQLDEWVKNAISEGAQDSNQLRRTGLDDLILREAISQDVSNSRLLSIPSNASKLKLGHQNVLIEIWFANYLAAHPISEQDIKAEFERQIALSKDPKNATQYQISQIAVGSESEALQLKKKIDAGTGFEPLAKEKSADKATAINGGLVGWVFPYQLAVPVNEIVPKLHKGDVTRPIPVGGAWYLIKLVDSKPLVMLEYEQAKPNLIQTLIQNRRQEAFKIILDSAKVIRK